MSEFQLPSQSLNNCIIWAVDPFGSETEPSSNLVKQFVRLMKSANIEIIVAYSLPSDSLISINAAEIEVDEYLLRLGIEQNLRIEVVKSYGTSSASRVKEIIKLSEQLGALFLVASTHGRSGLERVIIGSFAESLLLESKLPMLFLPKSVHTIDAEPLVNTVIFSTDFSSFSKAAFLSFLEMARLFHFEIIIHYSISFPLAATASGYAGEIAIPDSFFASQISWANEEGKIWLKDATDKGVKARLLFKNNGINSNTALEIIDLAKAEKAKFIATASNSTPLVSVLLGSVAREIFRSNLYPVWMYGPRNIDKHKTEETRTSQIMC